MKALIFLIPLLLSCAKEKPLSSELQSENKIFNATTVSVLWVNDILDSIYIPEINRYSIGFEIPDGYEWSGVIFYVNNDNGIEIFTVPYTGVNIPIIGKYVRTISKNKGDGYKTYFFSK